MYGRHRFPCMTTPLWLHLAVASGPDQRSTAVPPTLLLTRPIGTAPFSDWYTDLPKYQHTAENGLNPFPVQAVAGEATAQGTLLEKVVKRMLGNCPAAAHSAVALMSWPRPKAMFDCPWQPYLCSGRVSDASNREGTW